MRKTIIQKEELLGYPTTPDDKTKTTHFSETVKMVGGKIVKSEVIIDDRRFTSNVDVQYTSYDTKPSPAAGKPSTERKPDTFRSTDSIQITRTESPDRKKSPERRRSPDRPSYAAGKPSQPVDKFGRPIDLFEEPGRPHKPSEKDLSPSRRLVPHSRDETDRVTIIGGKVVSTSHTSKSSTVVQEAVSSSTESVIRKGVRRIITDKGVVEEILPETVVSRRTSDTANVVSKQSHVVHEDSRTLKTTERVTDVRELKSVEEKPKGPKDRKPKEPVKPKEQCICEICTCG